MPTQSIEDPRINIQPNDYLVKFIQQNVTITDTIPPNIQKIKSKNPCTLKLDDLKWLNNYLKHFRTTTKQKIYLHELLTDSSIELPTPKKIPRSPELEARIKKLIAQQNTREYQAMTKNVDCVRNTLPEDTIAYQMKQMDKQLIAVAQFVFSVLAGFAFGFVGIEWILGNLDFGFRLLLGIIFALIIALAEIYFLAMKLNEDHYYEGHTLTSQPKKKLHQE